MLRYFRINDPYRLLGLLAILLIIFLPLFIDSPGVTYAELKNFVVGEKVHEGMAMYTEIVDSTAPLAAWSNGLMDILFGRSLIARHIFAFILIFLQASYLGIVFSNKKAFAENSYIPSLIFAILITFSFDTLSLTPELVGAAFLLPALNNLFKEIEFREQRNESIFNLGLYLGIASLFVFSYSIYLVGTVITLVIFTRSSVRQFFLLVFGFLIPHMLLLSSYFLMDGLSEIWQYYYVPNLSLRTDRYISNGSLWTLSALPLIFLLISFVMMNRDARLSKYQTQLVQSMFFWMIFSVIQVLCSKDLRPQNCITLIPSLSFFITHFLLLVRRKKFAEIHVWILLIGTIIVSYSARYGLLNNVNYTQLLVPDKEMSVRGKRVLALDNDLSIYKHNQFASVFVNWDLSKDIFAHPEYYENVIQVYEGLNSDPPDVIRDNGDLLKPFLEKIPKLRALYHKQGNNYVKKSP